MATWYVDLEGGNNANTGLSFAQRRKTLTSINAASAGDEIRLMASLDPTLIGNATWNNLSKSVTIPAGITMNIDLCETAWTGSSDVTSTTSTTNKQGTNAVSLAIAGAFGTGLVAYKTLSATDFSGYEQVSFWIRTSSAIASGELELRLCSDTVGAVTVDTIPIPAISTTALYTPVTYDTGGPLGSSIQSVALYANTDPGTKTILLDNILACKASSSDDALTLTSLIGKNTAGETFHAIQSINGTSVLLDNGPNTLASAGRGYYGTTETVATYKRETVPTAISTTSDLQVLSNGTATNPITISGGWNRTDMSTQTGETWVTVHNGAANGLSFTNREFIEVSKLNVVRGAENLFMNGTNLRCSFTDCAFNNGQGAVFVTDTAFSLSATNLFTCNNNTSVTFGGANVFFTNFTSNSNNVGLSSTLRMSQVINARIHNNGAISIYAQSTTLIVRGGQLSNNVSGILNQGQQLVLIDVLNSDSPEVTSSFSFSNFKVYSERHDLTADYSKIFMDGALIESELGADRRTPSGMAWKLSPTSANRSILYPVSLDGIKIACIANAQVTVSVWCKRSSSGITGRLFMQGNQISGVPNDVSAVTTGTAGTYEQLTINFTPTEKGVVDILLQAYGGTTDSVWFDDATINQA